MRRLALLALAALLLSAPPALATGRLHVVVRGQDHRPVVGKKWRYWVRVTDAKTGKPVACKIHLQFLFGTIPVGQVGRHTLPKGYWQETFGTPGNPPFPPQSRGQRVTLQATATARGYRPASAGWWVQPK